MKEMNVFGILVVFVLMLAVADSGPLAYAICQTGCNALVVACYAGAGKLNCYFFLHLCFTQGLICRFNVSI